MAEPLDRMHVIQAEPARFQRAAVRFAACTLVLMLLIAGAGSAAAKTHSSRNPGNGSHPGGLGKVLSSANGGQIFGFDVNQNGTDGIIDDALVMPDGSLKSAIETFDINTAKITKTVKTLLSPDEDQELVTFGIGGNDVGLVDEQRDKFKNGRVVRNDRFFILNPVSGEQITGPWTIPNNKNSLLAQLAQNQATDTQVTLVYRPAQGFNEMPWLYVTDLATNTILKTIKLTDFEDDFLIQIAQDSAKSEVVTFINSFPGGPAPVNVVINLNTEKSRRFNGFNNGPFGAGAISGLAIDSTTHILCTTTNLNAQVEFYKIAKGTGTWAQLPGTGNADELTSGTAVANDSLNHLFLVAQPVSSTGGDSAIYVYDEKGNLQETLNGFSFNRDLPSDFGVKIVLIPSLRMGWVNGASVTELQQFFY